MADKILIIGSLGQVGQELFESLKKAIICSSRIFGEGVNIPVCDSVCFADNKNSAIDIVQYFSRCLTKYSLNPNKIGHILIPFILVLTVSMPQWVMILLMVVTGVGMAGVGMNVMHDANHESFSKRKWVNKLMGSSIYILAGNVYNWKVQHNVLHHTYTNIPGHDEDLDAGRVIRFTKEAKWEKFHKFQHYYSVFLYGLLTFNWCLTTDFKQMAGYLKRKLSYGEVKSPKILWTTLVITKIIYFNPIYFDIVTN